MKISVAKITNRNNIKPSVWIITFVVVICLCRQAAYYAILTCDWRQFSPGDCMINCPSCFMMIQMFCFRFLCSPCFIPFPTECANTFFAVASPAIQSGSIDVVCRKLFLDFAFWADSRYILGRHGLFSCKRFLLEPLATTNRMRLALYYGGIF
jgi:hypothetical protein